MVQGWDSPSRGPHSRTDMSRLRRGGSTPCVWDKVEYSEWEEDVEPQVEVVAEGDHINEIFVVVAGHLEILKPGEQDIEDTVLSPDGNKSVHLGERYVVLLVQAPHIATCPLAEPA